MARVCVVSLGCAKNLVNTEQMMWLLDEAGYRITAQPDGADVAVVNTCGFIDSAKREAIETILELTLLKAEGRLKRVVVVGCLAERYKKEIFDEVPEVDGLVGCGSFDDIVGAVDQVLLKGRPAFFDLPCGPVSEVPRMLTTPQSWSWLKLSEGCDNRCAYCAIPGIRGNFRSRPMENILGEAAGLVSEGARELVLIAQDLTRYGFDLYGERRLPRLLRDLCALDDLEWIRLQYLYPDDIDEELIATVAGQGKILKYLDIPFQHADDGVLAAMNRRGTGESYRTLVRTLRDRIPGIVLRTTAMVGFPGETDEAFENLCDFLREARFERVGLFAYSAEEGTPAASLPDPIDADTISRRLSVVETLRCELLDAYNEGRVGETIDVLCEAWDQYAECWFGRSQADSPEVDGKIFFICLPDEKPKPGDMVRVKITNTIDGDLEGIRV